MLSCMCDFDEDSCGWYYYDAEDFGTLPGKRAVRCQSCQEKIRAGSTCLAFHRIKYDDNGNEVPLADRYLCESCGEIHLNLTAAGYCCNLGTDLREDLAEYHALTGFSPEKYRE